MSRKDAKAAKKQNKFPNLAFLAALARGISESDKKFALLTQIRIKVRQCQVTHKKA
jgi:hypothetical protein